MISPAEISGFLNAIEQRNQKLWSSTYVREKQFWKVTHSGTVPRCEIYVEMNGSSLCLQVELGEFRVRPECQAALHFFLLRLNEDLPVLKFGLRESGRVTLMAESLSARVDLGTFEELLQALVAVFGQYRREIELLAAEKQLADFVMKSFQAAVGSPRGIIVGETEPARQATQP